MSAVDSIAVEQDTASLEFVLNAGLAVRAEGAAIERLGTSDDGLKTAYRATLQVPGRRLKLHYHGRPRFSGRRSHGDMPRGILSAEGVYMDGASAWYPLFDWPSGGFRLSVGLPPGWESVSAGRRSQVAGRVTWSSEQPHDDLYLIADRFRHYQRRHGSIDLSVWLLQEDDRLAATYLGLMGEYIDHYSELIGDYPFAKFAVVENRWQTGLGMPSFTLLGSRVLRLPFIPFTSLPHEILHNWWGNGVWVDYSRGNWSEGLTAYLADHWMKERRGQGADYRLKALQRYSNFAADGADMPLLDFVSRHDDTSQSIGYSKSLMLFHMLRRALGDAAFDAGLRRLWQRHRFSAIGFTSAVDAIVGDDAALAEWSRQWLTRSDAPRLRLGETGVEAHGAGYRLTVEIVQDNDPPFVFDLPLAVELEGAAAAERLQARVDAGRQRLQFDLPRRPLRLEIDPGYDLLRYLDPTEQPPALNQLFGADEAWLVIPSAATAEMGDAWRALAAAWQRRYPGLRVIDDSAATQLPRSAHRLLLGWDNRLLEAARPGLARAGQRLERRALSLGNDHFPAARHSVVLVGNDAAGVVTAFVGAPTAQAVATLARKLTHYGSFGRLVFDADSGDNQVRDALTSTHSRLARRLTEASPGRPSAAGDGVQAPAR